MLLDNTKDETADKTVGGWLSKYAEDGGMDVVTGCFTIGALSWLSERINGKIERFRFIWGGIAAAEGGEAGKFDLLNQEIGIESALRLRKLAKSAARFLEQDKVEVKTAEPGFCRAKMFLLNASDDKRKFFVTGSSDLTEAGLGVRPAVGAELNAAVSGGDFGYGEYAAWFDGLWNNTQKAVEAKQEFLDEIAKIFEEYTPCDVYMKILYELLPEDLSQEHIEQRLGKTEIYKALFPFQKKAVASLVKMLEKKNGAILADAVGLGKTFTALAIIKYYRMQNREVVVLTPKRMRHNWERYTWHDDIVPEGDNFDYEIIFHTDLNEDGLSDRLEYLTNDKPRLFVIDESHNLQNDKSGKYQFLLEKLLRKNNDVKVLMLSAAPIHGSLWGLRNQLKLIGGFENVDALFRRAQEKLGEWAKAERPAVGALIGALRGIDGGNLLKLTDTVILARTRAMVANSRISFPTIEKPVNIFETPNCVENAATITDIIDMLPIRFTAYMSTAYVGLTNKQVTAEDAKRSLFLVKMIHILLIKRLESSWISFKATLEKITADHKDVLRMLERSGEIDCPDVAELLQDEESPEFDELVVGKKQRVSMRDIRDVNKYEKDLMEDVGKLDKLLKEIEQFSLAKDLKIKRLIEEVEGHLPDVKGSGKALIFTAYSDTAEYLFNCLRVYFGSRANVECVKDDTKNVDDIVNRFSPKTNNANDKQLKTPIDILIATDVLSGGQSLQDCDLVINYDIHWNPVRVVQRVGRIDRIGGKKSVHCVNFWPVESIDEYMNLYDRVEDRMSVIKLAGSSVPDDIHEEAGKINRVGASALERDQIKKSLIVMRDSIENTEPENFGLSHLSLEVFRQDLTQESAEKYKNLPHGICTGFKADQRGLIALLRHRKSKDKKIAFINESGEEILASQQEILQFLHDRKEEQRDIPAAIETCDAAEIEKLSAALRAWLESRISAEIKVVMDGLFAGGQAALDLSAKQKKYLEETLAPDNWDLMCWVVVGGGCC